MARSTTPASGDTPFAAFVTLRGSHRNERLVTGFMILLVLPWSLLADEKVHLPVVTMVLLLAGLAAFTVIYIRRLPARLRSDTGPGVLPGRSTMAFVLLTTATGCLAVASIQIGWIWLMLPAYAVTDLLLSEWPAPWRVLTPTAAAVGAAGGVSVFLFSDWPEDSSTAGLVGGILTTVMILGFAGYEAMQLQLWRSAVELEKARRDADSVATMRERLRLAEDLHDILGHALESVALKSELAARLSATDPDRAGSEMVEVQQLARQTIRDVRDVVHRVGRTDLVVELVGVRDLLASAGIGCEVRGDPRALDMAVRDLFGRVVREAVTNALRHADLTRCDVTVSTGAGTAEVRVRTDGVGRADTTESGSGLDGLRRRLRDAGGELTAGVGPEPGTFTVCATLPVTAGQVTH